MCGFISMSGKIILLSELQIRGGTRDNFSYFSMKTYIVTHHWNCLDETVLMRGHNISFIGKLRKTEKIIPKLSLVPLLICSTGL